MSNEDKLNRHFLDEEFKKTSMEPMYWHAKSEKLSSSAGVLWVSMKPDQSRLFKNELGFSENYNISSACRSVFIMLCGLSIELAIKSILAVKGETIAHHHKLSELLQSTGIILTQSENNLLDIYSEYILWAGKYPTPTHSQYFGNLESCIQKTPDETISSNTGEVSFPGSEIFNWDRFNAIHHKITSEFWILYKESHPYFEPDLI